MAALPSETSLSADFFAGVDKCDQKNTVNSETLNVRPYQRLTPWASGMKIVHAGLWRRVITKRGKAMKRHVLALAALTAIGFSGAAFAGEARHPSKATAPVIMSDSELDSTYAGGHVSRFFQVTTVSSGAAQGAQPRDVFHQMQQQGTGRDHTKFNCVANPGNFNC